MRIPELLVPASSWKYCRLRLYLVRMQSISEARLSVCVQSKELSKEDMSEGVRFAHEHGVKVYVTANILAHNQDLEASGSILKNSGKSDRMH